MTESVNTELRIAVIGAGPAGVYSSDIFLRQLKKLGEELGLGTEARIDLFEKLPVPFGLVRYGVAPDHPSIKFIASALEKTLDNPNIHLYCDVEFGKDVTLDDLLARYDAVLFATGAVKDKPLNLPGADLEGVYGAAKFVEWYDGYPTGAREWPLTAENVAVIGGGNVAMDVTRSSIRLGAGKVTCVYRRRLEDMTALPDEVAGATAEGAEMMTLAAPVRIEADEDGVARALWVQPQIIGDVDSSGRPKPNKAALDQVRIPADIIVVAIGQGIEIQGFDQAGVPITRGGRLVAALSGQVNDMDNIFAGGDCVTGPATAIRAIAAGKVAAANIDEHLGFHHEIRVDVDIPAPRLNNRPPHGRINTTERQACERKCDFEDIECGLTEEGAVTEASRCLRCDHFGYGIFRGGRDIKW